MTEMTPEKLAELQAILAEALAMWEAYELYGLDMEGNPFRGGGESVRPTSAIVMVLNLHAALRSALTLLAADALAAGKCPTCGGHGADPASDNVNWLPCKACGGSGRAALAAEERKP